MNFSVQDKIHYWEDHAHLKEQRNLLFLKVVFVISLVDRAYWEDMKRVYSNNSKGVYGYLNFAKSKFSCKETLCIFS